ncbi:hypothetical protein [Streptomyces sp. NPDC088115]|uniref:hypothetical protein n=1 Tax=Streptomyces sp. NPDC088115 TaxID=3365824 RepID=UPI00381FCD45
MAIRKRYASRVLLTDERDRLLSLCGRDPQHLGDRPSDRDGRAAPPVLTGTALPHPPVHLGDFDVDEQRDAC